MRTYILKTFKYLFKQNIFTSLISVFLLSVISIMFSFCNFNLDQYLNNYQDATYQQYKIPKPKTNPLPPIPPCPIVDIILYC